MSSGRVFLALDYGRRRIGVAVSTPIGTVHPRPPVHRETPPEDIAVLKLLVEEVRAGGIVVGLPHHMDGTESDMEREARSFAVELAGATGLPVFGTDERLTTSAADSILRAQDVHGRKRKARRDSTAACVILHDFLAHDRRERIA